ncbi:MAG: ABC transporter ATP-binding protein/permease [Eubacteriaceae bacterium]|nr:ABC transporter ATP-binding protein/permease [Eubacteriaceae bacterium]
MRGVGGGGGGRGRGRPLTEEEKKNQPKITMALLKRVFSYLLPYWPRLLLVLGCILFSSWLSLMPSILMGRMVDEGFIGQNLDMLLKLIAASFGVLTLSNLIGVLESWLNTWIAQHITYDMRNKMFRHLLNMSTRFFNSSKQGEVITRMTSDISSVQSVISGTLTGLINNISVLTLALITMYQKNWILASAGVLILPLLLIPTQQVGKKRWEITYKAQAKNDEINQILSETLSVSGQMLVKLFAREDMEYNKYEKANAEMIDLNIQESMTGRWFRATMGILTNAGPMVIYLVGGLLMLKYGVADLTVGDITVMVALLGRLYGPANFLLNMQVDIIRSMAVFTRLFDYYDMPIEIESKTDAIVPEGMQGLIEFDSVNFHYNEETPILHNIDFAVQPGHSAAIVGPSGAGKSTIINLIPRLYDIIDGQIRLDGNDIRDLDLTWLRSNIGLVTQDTYLFNGTIRENLLYANFEATDEELIRACKEANIHDFIDSLPDKYETQVGNRGIKLSGGERQRLSIARVILKDPGLIILDEATSSLDSISESLIQDAIEPLLKGKTSLVIAHRLSTIMACDEILVISEGALVERGTHSKLLELNGVYRMLYETQFRKALEDASEQKSIDFTIAPKENRERRDKRA